ncbi:MAG: carboxynorspermidine decarboxylase [Fibrobacterales bacterium]
MNSTLLQHIPSPCFILDEALLKKNIETLHNIQIQSGGKIIVALKGYAFKESFPLIRNYLPGTTASSLHEAQLAAEYFGGEIHAYAPAYQPDEIEKIISLSSHITFNSLTEWGRYKNMCAQNTISCGLRLNPEYSEVEHDIYNPCVIGSRFGITIDNLKNTDLTGIEGLHFHALCEQGSDTLERVFEQFENKFGSLLHSMKWLNMGGGHHITRKGYDQSRLIAIIKRIRTQYNIQVILEPGEAIGLNTGYLKTTVLDIIDNRFKTAMIDASFAAHMPDCLEMPYFPDIEGAEFIGTTPPDTTSIEPIFRLGGTTCMAGDYLGFYRFATPLKPNDTIIFKDMIHYTMVKTNHFNGVKHPSIGTIQQDGSFIEHTRFTYNHYANRI